MMILILSMSAATLLKPPNRNGKSILKMKSSKLIPIVFFNQSIPSKRAWFKMRTIHRVIRSVQNHNQLIFACFARPFDLRQPSLSSFILCSTHLIMHNAKILFAWGAVPRCVCESFCDWIRKGRKSQSNEFLRNFNAASFRSKTKVASFPPIVIDREWNIKLN